MGLKTLILMFKDAVKDSWLAYLIAFVAILSSKVSTTNTNFKEVTLKKYFNCEMTYFTYIEI